MYAAGRGVRPYFSRSDRQITQSINNVEQFSDVIVWLCQQCHPEEALKRIHNPGVCEGIEKDDSIITRPGPETIWPLYWRWMPQGPQKFLWGKQSWFPAMPAKQPPHKYRRKGNRHMEVPIHSRTQWGIPQFTHASVLPPPPTGHTNHKPPKTITDKPYTVSGGPYKQGVWLKTDHHGPTRDKSNHLQDTTSDMHMRLPWQGIMVNRHSPIPLSMLPHVCYRDTGPHPQAKIVT